MLQEVLPHMRRQKRGRIINISTEQGIYGLLFGTPYSSSKAALESLSEGLSIELIPWNIHVSILEPSGVSTQFSTQYGTRIPEKNPYKAILETIKKLQQQKNDNPESPGPSHKPEEIAELIDSILSEESPKLRYQTSDLAKQMVSIKLSDLTAEAYFNAMKEWRAALFGHN